MDAVNVTEAESTDRASEVSSEENEPTSPSVVDDQTVPVTDGIQHTERELAILGKNPNLRDATLNKNRDGERLFERSHVQSRSFIFPSSFALRRNSSALAASQVCSLEAVGTSRKFIPEEYDVASNHLPHPQFQASVPSQTWNTQKMYYRKPQQQPLYSAPNGAPSHRTSIHRAHDPYRQPRSQVNQSRGLFQRSDQPAQSYNSEPPPAPPQLYQHYAPFQQPEPIQQYYDATASQAHSPVPYYSTPAYAQQHQQQQHYPQSQPYPPNQQPYVMQAPLPAPSPPPPPAPQPGPYYGSHPPVYPQNPAAQQYTPPVGYPGTKHDPWQHTRYGPPSATILMSPAEIEALQGNGRRKISAARERLLAEQFAKVSVRRNIPIQSDAAHPLSAEEVLNQKELRRRASAPISPVKPNESSPQPSGAQRPLQRASTATISSALNASKQSTLQTSAESDAEVSVDTKESRKSDVSTSSSSTSVSHHSAHPPKNKLGSRFVRKFMRSRPPTGGGSPVSQETPGGHMSELSETKVGEIQRALTMPVPAGQSNSAEPNENSVERRTSEPVPLSRMDTYVSNTDASGQDSAQPVLSPLSSQFYAAYVRSDFAPKTRRYRALIVGITYRDYADYISYLPGAITDVSEVFLLLVAKFGFKPEHIRVMSDEKPNKGEVSVELPTKTNIMKGMRWLWEGAQSGDSLFFFFAGHGHLLHDVSGDERDSEYDQCLTPIDWKTAGYIEDDSIYEWLITRIPYGARLTCLIDACTSGTVCDLPFLYTSNRGSRGEPQQPMPPRRVMQPGVRVGESVLFAGSADLQKAADIHRPSRTSNESYGLMTRAFVDAILELLREQSMGVPRTFADLVHSISQRVQYIGRSEGLEMIQQPQFSSSHEMDLHAIQFSL